MKSDCTGETSRLIDRAYHHCHRDGDDGDGELLSKAIPFLYYVSNSICLNENELLHKCNPAQPYSAQIHSNGNDTSKALEKCL